VIGRAGAALRDAVVHEHAVRHAAEAAADAPAAAPPPAPAAAPRPRRLDGLAARLRSGVAAVVTEPQAAPVKSLLRARAQGP
jgi:hypothetical protein